MGEIYIDQSRLDAIANAVAALKPCPISGKVTRNQIVEVLGVVGDVWPAEILPDLIREGIWERECKDASQLS